MNELKGYKGIGPEAGQFIAAEDAYEHVLQACGLSLSDASAPLAQEAKQALVEWYFSGNWVEVYENGRN